jgi:hypothetical protein
MKRNRGMKMDLTAMNSAENRKGMHLFFLPLLLFLAKTLMA